MGIKINYRIIDCIDCGDECTEIFMAKDRLWYKFTDNGMLCLSCFEKRLGRKIVKKDLTKAPCNKHIIEKYGL